MFWIFVLLVVAGMVWFLFAPRRFQTLENVPQVIDEQFRAHGVVETTEDPREVRPIAEAAAKKLGDLPPKGHGDSLTFDWRNDTTEPHANYQASQDTGSVNGPSGTLDSADGQGV